MIQWPRNWLDIRPGGMRPRPHVVFFLNMWSTIRWFSLSLSLSLRTWSNCRLQIHRRTDRHADTHRLPPYRSAPLILQWISPVYGPRPVDAYPFHIFPRSSRLGMFKYHCSYSIRWQSVVIFLFNLKNK